ncbi:MAG: transporter substrate-binding domain-containing protein [Opitutaceae bacterium]
MKNRRGLMFALSFVACATLAAADPVVKLCADQWMPYNGDPAGAKPGYVIELARAVFEPQGLKVDYTVMPYEEALGKARSGEMTGVIGPNEEEGKDLVLPKEPIGSLATCLLTLAENAWSYDNIASFRRARLGAIKGYTYWPALDTYIERNVGKDGVFIAEGDEPLAVLMQKLQAREIDVVVESEPILLWYLRSHDLDRNQFRVVFKGTNEPIYLAFAPNDEGRRLAAVFDEGVRALRASGELTKLLSRYGLRDWQ